MYFVAEVTKEQIVNITTKLGTLEDKIKYFKYTSQGITSLSNILNEDTEIYYTTFEDDTDKESLRYFMLNSPVALGEKDFNVMYLPNDDDFSITITAKLGNTENDLNDLIKKIIVYFGEELVDSYKITGSIEGNTVYYTAEKGKTMNDTLQDTVYISRGYDNEIEFDTYIVSTDDNLSKDINKFIKEILPNKLKEYFDKEDARLKQEREDIYKTLLEKEVNVTKENGYYSAERTTYKDDY